jgi:hypothetical protein
MDIDRLSFTSSGGRPAATGIRHSNFAMDNFTVEFIPKPSSFLLGALGAVSVVALLRRKRA